MYPEYFSIKLHHGGFFTGSPGRMYLKGKVDFIDLLETKSFSLDGLALVMQELGYDNREAIYYHFLAPGGDLDYGINALEDDEDILRFINYVHVNKFDIAVYTEHGNIHVLNTHVEPEIKVANANVNVNEVGEDRNNEKSDNGFFVDKNSDTDVVEVDIKDFKFDPDENFKKLVDDEVLDNENFDSGEDSDENVGSIRKRKLKYLRKSNENNFYLGQLFGSKQEVKSLISAHAVETRRQLKLVEDDKQRIRAQCVGTIPTFDVDEDGVLNESQQPNANNSGKKDEGSQIKNIGGRGNKTNPLLYSCPWVLLVSKDKGSESWMVKTYIAEHKCLQSRNIHACTSSFLSKHLMDQLEENPDIPVKAVQEQCQRKFEVGVSKMKSFRAKSKAMLEIHGDYSSQYGLLRDYIDELLRTNPGTTIKLDVEPISDQTDTRRFKRIYVCLGSLKEGFKAIGRDLLGLDGAFMKGPFPGQILSAVGVDPNNGIYPLSYAIVEAENLSSWTWFIQCLGDDLGLESNSNFTFISDRQKGILQAISRVFPCAEHRFCLRHIHENMKQSFKGKAYKDILWKLATSTTVIHFERTMDELKNMNSNAHSWLLKIPPIHWSRSHFSGRAHSDVLLNNMREVFNSKILDGRDKPIITALEYIREYLMRRIVNVQQVIDGCIVPLTPTASKLFEVIKKDAAKFNVIWNGGDQYQVTGPFSSQFVVDVARKFCTCRRWEITGIPCAHAVASIWNMATNSQNVGLPENWVLPVYMLETWKNVYSFKIYPVNGRSMWVKSRVPTTLTAPTHHKPVGRPKKVRRKSTVEMEDMTREGRLSKKNSSNTCGKCKKRGHNSRTCKGQEQV